MLLKALKKNSIFRFFASLKLAVILLVALAIILAVATFYESVYDTKTAQYLVYRSPLFALFLTVLGINLSASAIIRYPWSKAQTGFVVTHVGIIIILIGSLLTMWKGLDGSMMLEEGEVSNKVTIDQPILYFGPDIDNIREMPAEYRWNRPKPGKSEYRYPLGEDGKLVAVIDDYYHHAEAETLYIPDPVGMPALELRLHNANVDQKVWLTPADGKVTMGLAQLELFRLPDKAAEEAFKKPADAPGRGTLQVLIGSTPIVVDLDRVSEKPYPLEFPGASLKLLRYLPHAVVEEGKLLSKSEQPINPAVEVELTTTKGAQRWLLFSALPELNTRIDSQGEAPETRLIYNRPEAPQARTLELGLTSDGRLLYRFDGKRSGEFKDTALESGWMDLKIEKVNLLERARRERHFREVFPKKGAEDKAPGPAIRMRVEGAASEEPFWLERGDIRKVLGKEGQESIVGYGYKTVSLPFEIKLKEFRIGYDPGTKTAATYESDIVVGEKEFTVAMNSPYEHEGTKVFQASYGDTPDGRNISVFAVANDPGIELKYFGSIMLVIGIIIQFYFKPRKKTRVAKDTESAEEASLA